MLNRETMSPNLCSHCGEPMFHLADFGTNSDGTVNTDYCRSCFQKGRLVEHGITPEREVEVVRPES